MGELEPRYASWGRRVVAYVLDLVVATVLFGVFMGVGAGVGAAAGGVNGLWVGFFIGLFLGLFVVYGAYWAYLEGRPSGQTVGKRIVGIRVRAAEGGPAGYGKALGRNVVKLLISFVPFGAPLDLLWPLWDARKQCLHDKAASTVVIQD